RFMLWAKSTRDLDENSEAYYSFPAKYALHKLETFGADYAATNNSIGIIDPVAIKLSGQPIIFVQTNTATDKRLSASAKPGISAGTDTIIHQQFIILHGQSSGTSENNYYWDLIKLPASQGDYPSIKNKNTLTPALMGLQKGVYGVRLTATNQNGQFATDT